MNKNRLLLIIVCLFLVHSQVAATSNLGTLPLIPPGKVSSIKANQEIIFLKDGLKERLPGINTILEDEKIEPHEVEYTQIPLGSS